MINYPAQILDSTKYVVDNSEHIKISQEGIEQFCRNVDFSKEKGTDWLKQSPFPIDELSEKDKTHLMLTFNALSFSYWGDPYWQVTYKDTTHQRGSWSLIAALLRAKEEGINILNPEVQRDISLSDLKNVLRGNREISLIKERHKIITELGDIISTNYEGDFRNVIGKNPDAYSLLATIIEEIPSFEDKGEYKGREIKFYKRAQALVESMAMLHPIENEHSLTALADYILPRKLRDEGVLEYSPSLAKTIDYKILIPAKSRFEMELRANTIHAVEQIKNTLHKDGLKLSSKEINDYLWLTGDQEKTTYHRTRTTDY